VNSPDEGINGNSQVRRRCKQALSVFVSCGRFSVVSRLYLPKTCHNFQRTLFPPVAKRSPMGVFGEVLAN
jgi:hypothetical protein